MTTGVFAVTQRPVSVNIYTTVTFNAQFFQGNIFGKISGVQKSSGDNKNPANLSYTQLTASNLSPISWENTDMNYIMQTENIGGQPTSTGIPEDLVFDIFVQSEITDNTSLKLTDILNTTNLSVSVYSYIVNLSDTQVGRDIITTQGSSYANAEDKRTAIEAKITEYTQGITQEQWGSAKSANNNEYDLGLMDGTGTSTAKTACFIRVVVSVQDITKSITQTDNQYFTFTLNVLRTN